MKRAAQQHGEAAPPKRLRSSYSEVFKVVVGSGVGNPETFIIHQDILTRQSEVFKTAGKSPPNKDQDKQNIVRLPLVYPFNFRIYLNLVYNPAADELEVVEFVGHAYYEDLPDGKLLQDTFILHQLCRLWVNTEYLKDTETTDRVMAAIIYHTTKTQCHIGPFTMTIVARAASGESGLYRWMVDFISRTFEADEMARAIETEPGLSTELVPAVLEKLVSLRAKMSMPTDAAAYLSSDKAA